MTPEKTLMALYSTAKTKKDTTAKHATTVTTV